MPTKTERLALDPARPDPAALRRAAAVLARGGLVAFPTETVYGLGALALDPAAVARIFAAKGRPSTNPLIVHVHHDSLARQLADPFTPLAAALTDAFWPGPLTVVVPRSARVPDAVSAGGPTVALRSPAHRVALGLLAALGAPVAAPSANPSGAVSPTSADHVLAGLDGRIDLVLDAGPCPLGIESTVVDATGDAPLVLRPGSVSRDAIALVAARLALRRPASVATAATAATAASAASAATAAPLGPPASAVSGPSVASAAAAAVAAAAAAAAADATAAHAVAATPARSPGQLARHYAPRTPLSLLTRPQLIEALRHRSASETPALVWCGRAPSHPPGAARSVELPDDPDDYAAQLYATLHELDGQASALWVERPPSGPAWEALHDRLGRASQR